MCQVADVIFYQLSVHKDQNDKIEEIIDPRFNDETDTLKVLVLAHEENILECDPNQRTLRGKTVHAHPLTQTICFSSWTISTRSV